MTKSLPDTAPTSNTQTDPVIRIVEGIYPERHGLDAIVSFLPEDLSWQGPVNALILQQVGPALDAYILDHIIAPKRGDVFAVPSGIWDGPRLLFAIVPRWGGGMEDEERTLTRCTRGLLQLAEHEGIGVIAMPALGAGRKDYPVRRAARLVIRTIREHSFVSLREIRIACKSHEMVEVYRDLLK